MEGCGNLNSWSETAERRLTKRSGLRNTFRVKYDKGNLQLALVISAFCDWVSLNQHQDYNNKRKCDKEPVLEIPMLKPAKLPKAPISR